MGDGGKGSRARPYSVPLKTFDNNWDNIFKKDKDMQVRVAEEGKKIGTCGCGRSPTGDCIGWHGLNEEQLKAAQEKYQAQLTENK
jgi:hypothetical protein